MLLSLLCQHLRLMHYSLVSSVALWQKAFSFFILRAFSLVCCGEHTLIILTPSTMSFSWNIMPWVKKRGFFLSSNIILLFFGVLVLRTRLRSLSTQHLLSGILNSNSFSKLKAVALKLHLSQFKNEISIIGMSWGHKYITRNMWRQGGKCLSY